MNGYDSGQHGCFPLVMIYDNDDNGWAPVIAYRGWPPVPGDKITVREEWIGKDGEGLLRQETQHFIVVGRHLMISKRYGSLDVERIGFEIGVEKANVSKMTIERKEDG